MALNVTYHQPEMERGEIEIWIPKDPDANEPRMEIVFADGRRTEIPFRRSLASVLLPGARRIEDD